MCNALSMLALLSFAALSFGQNMNVYTKNSSAPTSYSLASIDSITFDLGTSLGALHDPALVVQFTENSGSHNVHIASDGQYLYTINGGNAAGKIRKYTMAGVRVDSFSIAVDGRGLSYNKADGYFYASLYGGDIIKITNLSTGTYSTLFPAKMSNVQSCFAISPDGTKMYDFYNGTAKVYNFQTGTLIATYTGLSCGTDVNGGIAAIAVDADYMYTVNAATKTVYVYTLTGTLVRSMTLSSGSFGEALSVFDGYLFLATDGSYSAGTWYGYNIRLPLALPKKVAAAAPVPSAKRLLSDMVDTFAK
jgi:hypothetical protein